MAHPIHTHATPCGRSANGGWLPPASQSTPHILSHSRLLPVTHSAPLTQCCHTAILSGSKRMGGGRNGQDDDGCDHGACTWRRAHVYVHGMCVDREGGRRSRCVHDVHACVWWWEASSRCMKGEIASGVNVGRCKQEPTSSAPFLLSPPSTNRVFFSFSSTGLTCVKTRVHGSVFNFIFSKVEIEYCWPPFLVPAPYNPGFITRVMG